MISEGEMLWLIYFVSFSRLFGLVWFGFLLRLSLSELDDQLHVKFARVGERHVFKSYQHETALLTPNEYAHVWHGIQLDFQHSSARDVALLPLRLVHLFLLMLHALKFNISVKSKHEG